MTEVEEALQLKLLKKLAKLYDEYAHISNSIFISSLLAFVDKCIDDYNYPPEIKQKFIDILWERFRKLESK